jgi:sirohydrochlorin ferrochelatase
VTALILFSHGSLLCGAGEALEAHAARLRQTGRFERVEIGYLNYSEPSLATTVETLATEKTITDIQILPYFLAPGYFVKRALPAALEPIKERFPALSFTVSPAIGFDTRLADALLDAAEGARESDAWREPLARASASCRGVETCPLFATPACPKGAGAR